MTSLAKRFSRLSSTIIFLSTSLLLPVSVSAAEGEGQAGELLKKMSEAMRTQNYQGRFMYLMDRKMSSFQIQHAVIEGKEHERLVFLNHKDQEVVRVGHDVFCMHKGNDLFRDKHGVSANPFSGKLDKISDDTLSYYQLGLNEGKMIAGHEAYQVNFISKDAHRYNRHLWIAKSTYMLLKMDISNDIGEVLESFEFSQIDVGLTIPKSEFSHKDFVRHQAKHFEKNSQNDIEKPSQRNIEENPWKASWLPQGFYFSGSSHELAQGNDADGRKALELLMYTDGLSAISVFIEEVEHKSAFNESSQHGAVSAYSEVHVVDGKHVMVTSIGEVPLATLERITKGVVFQN